MNVYLNELYVVLNSENFDFVPWCIEQIIIK